MVNLIVNVIYGFIFQSIYVAYVYNKIKNVNYISTYIIYFFCYLAGAFITSFNYSFIYYNCGNELITKPLKSLNYYINKVRKEAQNSRISTISTNR